MECVKENFVKGNKKEDIRIERLLTIIQKDICDYFSTMSLDGYKLFITFINDYFHYAYVYLISKKI
jgi:hypothetical protein